MLSAQGRRGTAKYDGLSSPTSIVLTLRTPSLERKVLKPEQSQFLSMRFHGDLRTRKPDTVPPSVKILQKVRITQIAYTRLTQPRQTTSAKHLENRLRPHPTLNVHSAFPATVSLHDANMVESRDSQ